MIARLLLIASLVLCAAAPVQEPADPGRVPAPGAEPRTHYRGREIARTMHWRGAEWLLRETRETEEQALAMLAELPVEPGDVVCDLGCGNGYHTLPLARAVGEEGRVLGVDIQTEMLAMLAERAGAAGARNVVPVLGLPDDPRLEPGSCDLVLMADVYHEIDRPEAVLRHVRAALAPEGRLALVEFRLEDPDVPIKRLHKMSKAQILNELAPNGFALVREYDGLPRQHLMLFEARPQPEEETAESLAESRREHAREVACGWARALAAGDARVLEAFLAPRVEVRTGARIAGDGQGVGSLPRGEVCARYEARIQAAGRERWREEWSHEVRIELEPGEDSDVLELSLEGVPEGCDARFSLRHDAQGRWLVGAVGAGG